MIQRIAPAFAAAVHEGGRVVQIERLVLVFLHELQRRFERPFGVVLAVGSLDVSPVIVFGPGEALAFRPFAIPPLVALPARDCLGRIGVGIRVGIVET